MFQQATHSCIHSGFWIDLLDAGAKEILQNLSEKQGKKMNTAESAQNIPSFLEFFKV